MVWNVPYTDQGPHCTGKTGKMVKINSLSGKTQGIWKFCQNTGKTKGIWIAQVVSSLILKVIDISIIAAKISKFCLDCQVSLVCVIVTNHVNWHRENSQGDRENREFENTI